MASILYMLHVFFYVCEEGGEGVIRNLHNFGTS